MLSVRFNSSSQLVQDQNMDFSEKVVLITGATSGIGAETAKHFAKHNAKLALTGRNPQGLEDVFQACKANGSPDVILMRGDVTNKAFVNSIISETIKHFGKLDVLVNNAGILEIGSIETTNMDQFDRMMNVNVRSVYHLTHLAVPHLIKTQGAIVNVSSLVGLRAFPGVLSYCMNKAAIDQFTRCVALELASKNVRVNAVNPGVIVSNLHKRAGIDGKDYEALLERSKGNHPLGRPGTVDEVAKSILFLASEQSSFITAATLPIDGGKQAACPR
ncbi:3-oxoacyl-[acyl-carrier-protein] reductase FabG-like [Atheta coriaria]|uniref:3-oxoacyl-[acyl-carrier-protein] reductase FabG-like n=1 Tax=Dalotia coriaria TaxID=877792 RepID=UPI0031F40E16